MEALAISLEACTFGALASLITSIQVDEVILVVVVEGIHAILALAVYGADLTSGETVTVA